jgi:flagellar biosynthesis/type III secretory pathway M-ring protein FliF/YscJ
MKGVTVIAANPGPAVHMALLGVIIVIALIVYAIVRMRRRREAAASELLNHEEQIRRASALDRDDAR